MKNITVNVIKAIVEAHNCTLAEGVDVDDWMHVNEKIRVSRKQTGDYELVRFYKDPLDADTIHLQDWTEFLRELFIKHEIKFAVIGTRTGWDQRNWSYDSISIFVKFHN